MSDLRVSLFFPVFRDERTVRTVAEKAVALLRELCAEWEIIIVDDGSPDRSGAIADELAREHASIRVIHHGRNLGYGAAVRSGLAASGPYAGHWQSIDLVRSADDSTIWIGSLPREWNRSAGRALHRAGSERRGTRFAVHQPRRVLHPRRSAGEPHVDGVVDR